MYICVKVKTEIFALITTLIHIICNKDIYIYTAHVYIYTYSLGFTPVCLTSTKPSFSSRSVTLRLSLANHILPYSRFEALPVEVCSTKNRTSLPTNSFRRNSLPSHAYGCRSWLHNHKSPNTAMCNVTYCVCIYTVWVKKRSNYTALVQSYRSCKYGLLYGLTMLEWCALL